MSRIPKDELAIIFERASDDYLGFICEACGGPMGSEKSALHHRLPLSAGGEDVAVNLMLVHAGFRRNCHNLTEYSIHQNPARSYRLGHMVRRGTDPASVLVSVAVDLLTLRS